MRSLREKGSISVKVGMLAHLSCQHPGVLATQMPL
jgi:hypothetical protein